MNKKDIVKRTMRETGIKSEDVEKILSSILDNIKSSIAKGEAVFLVGFGIFKLIVRKQRISCHPKTGKTILIPSKMALKFMPGIELKAAIQSCNKAKQQDGFIKAS